MGDEGSEAVAPVPTQEATQAPSASTEALAGPPEEAVVEGHPVSTVELRSDILPEEVEVTPGERKEIESRSEFQDFLKKASHVVERALSVDFDILVDYTSYRGDEGYGCTPFTRGERMTDYMQGWTTRKGPSCSHAIRRTAL